jgi:hypothetical protein
MQQVNLYSAEFRPQVDFLTAERAAGLLGLVLAVLIGLQFADAQKLNAARDLVTDLEAQQTNLKQTADKLKKKPKAIKDPALELEVEHLREAIRNREGVAGIITNRSMGNDTGFSKHLVALGRHKVGGVALSTFALEAGGAFLRLEGMSQKPELVPLYVSQLQSDEHFSKTKFGFLTLQNHGAGVRFLLSGDGPFDPASMSFFTEEHLPRR